MSNELRSFGVEQIYSIALAMLLSVAVGITLGRQYVPWAYTFGALYGLFSYECWLIVVETYPYDEGGKPKIFDGKQVLIALTLPCGVVIAVAVALFCLVIATLWYLFNLVTRRCDYAE